MGESGVEKGTHLESCLELVVILLHLVFVVIDDIAKLRHLVHS